MDSKNIAFLICTNNDVYLEECEYYIRKLNVPEGYRIEIRSKKGAKSMTSGYNELASETDAEIKVYLHQDTFIINRYFINNILELFSTDKNVGMIGMVGYLHCSSNGVMWKNVNRVGNEVMYGAMNAYADADFSNYRYSAADGAHYVCMADGFCLVTNKNIEWDEKNFDGWDFYDADQCLNYIEKGYKIIVPVQKIPWCIHDDGKYLNLSNYEDYRQLYIAKHKDTLEELSKGSNETGDENEKTLARIMAAKHYKEENEEIRLEMKRVVNDYILSNSSEKLEKLSELVHREGFILVSESFRMINLIGALEGFNNKIDFVETFARYIKCSLMLRRIELFEEEVCDAVKWILENGIEPEAVCSILKTEIYEQRDKIVERIILKGLSELSERERLRWAIKLGATYHTDELSINVASMLMDYNEVSAALTWLMQIKNKSADINEMIDELKRLGF